MLADMVKKAYPDTRIAVKKSVEDARNYRVSFKKIRDVLGFKPAFTVLQAIRDIGTFVKKRPGEDFRSPTYVNHTLDY